MSSLQRLFHRFNDRDVRTVAVVDLQWGDAGKGKLVDCLAEWADITARGTGGANAGHSIKHGDEEYVFNLLPSGILLDDQGKLSVIGRGVAVEPHKLSDEIKGLLARGKSCNGLRVSHNAHLVLPFDIALDRLKESRGGPDAIGTTGRGIGPVYESHLARIGLFANDLHNKDEFARKLRVNLAARIGLFNQFDPEIVRRILSGAAFQNGAYYSARKIFDVDAIIEHYLRAADSFRDMIVDTDALMQRAVGRKRVLLEGAQGILLSALYGTYPYVTSSDCSLNGLAIGVGLQQSDVDYTLSIAKAPYMSRVGRGPFPTELGGYRSDLWCNGSEASKATELEQYPNASLNDAKDEFELGIAIRRAGFEYGSTTGRSRRVGWLDMPLLRYASQYGSTTLALTKADVMSACETIRICMQHRYEGPDYRVGGQLLTRGALLDSAIMDSYVLDNCTPVYEDFPGWCCSLDGIRSAKELPAKLQTIISMIALRGKVTVEVLSIGPDRDETIVL